HTEILPSFLLQAPFLPGGYPLHWHRYRPYTLLLRSPRSSSLYSSNGRSYHQRESSPFSVPLPSGTLSEILSVPYPDGRPSCSARLHRAVQPPLRPCCPCWQSRTRRPDQSLSDQNR